MVAQTPPISASIVQNVPTEMPSGNGIVDTQIDESTYVIRLSSGTVTVRVPQGSLTPGDSVSIAFSGDNVLIERLGISGEASDTLGDMLELHLGPKIDELVVLLKELQEALSSKQVETDLLRMLDSVLLFFEKKDIDVSSLLQVINQLKNEILLEPDTMNLLSDQKTVTHISKLLSYISEKISDISCMNKDVRSGSQSHIVTLSSSSEPGIYYVKNGNAALTFLLNYSNTLDHTTEKFIKPFEDTPLFIRFYESASGEKKALLMPREQALVEIEHILRVEVKSEIMRQLNPSLIAEMITQRGNVSMAQLLDIDKLLMVVSGDNNVSSVKEDALNITLPQLVAVALEIDSNKFPDFHTALTKVGSQIPDLVQEIIELLDKSSDVLKLNDLKKLIFESLSQDYIASNIDKKEDLLPSIFRKMGYSLEREMYTAFHEHSTVLQKDSPSLKLALLLILGYLNTLADEKSTGGNGSTTEKESTEKSVVSREAPVESDKTSKRFIQVGGQSERGTTPLSRIPAEMIRQQVETVLNRLESLQMLAKPIISSEGEQQVLVLPLNIGDEWTELRVKFVKKHRGKRKGREPEHISVLVNIDLKGLGEVTAYMEYHVKKSLHVSLTFDNTHSKIWFQENRKKIIEALTDLGFPIVHVRMLDKSVKKKKSILQSQKVSGPKASFDVLG